MTDREDYQAGPVSTQLEKNGESWTLALTRDLRHSRDKVWKALTDPAELSQWSPFDADVSLGEAGNAVKLTTVGAPTPHVTETKVTRADAPALLEYRWGDSDVRWKLEPLGEGTRLTLLTNIDKRFIAMGAAGWHLCLDVMDYLLSGDPIGRIVAADALHFEGWQRLNAKYSQQFGVEQPKW